MQAREKKPKPKRAKDVGADGIVLFTRRQAAQALGVSLATVRLWERAQTMVPRCVEGIHVFSRDQIETLRSNRVGKLSALAFRCFEDGLSPVQVVIKYGVDPERIAKMHAAYIRMTGSWVVKGPSGSIDAWERTYRIGPLTPDKLRRALELCASTPSLRKTLLGRDDDDTTHEPRSITATG